MADDEITGLSDSDMSVSIEASIDLAKLGNSLAQAEAMVRSSAQRMESSLKMTSNVSGGSGGGGIPSYAGGKISGGGTGGGIAGGSGLGSFAGGAIAGSAISRSLATNKSSLTGSQFTQYRPINSVYNQQKYNENTTPDYDAGSDLSNPYRIWAQQLSGEGSFTGSSTSAPVGSAAYFDEIKKRTQNAWSNNAYSSPIGPHPSTGQYFSNASGKFMRGLAGKALMGESAATMAGELTRSAGIGIGAAYVAAKGIQTGVEIAASSYDRTALKSLYSDPNMSGVEKVRAYNQYKESMFSTPIIGGFARSMDRFASSRAAAKSATSGVDNNNMANDTAAKLQSIEDTQNLNLKNLGGFGGFGNQRDQTGAAYDISVNSLNANRFKISKQQYANQKAQIDKDYSLTIGKINLDEQMTNTEINNRTTELSLNAMGMGAASGLYSAFHAYDNPIAKNTAAGNTGVVTNLLRQRNMAVAAQFMSGVKPAHAASAQLSGHRDVAIGSARGQDPAMIEKMVDALTKMTTNPPKIGRH